MPRMKSNPDRVIMENTLTEKESVCFICKIPADDCKGGGKDNPCPFTNKKGKTNGVLYSRSCGSDMIVDKPPTITKAEDRRMTKAIKRVGRPGEISIRA